MNHKKNIISESTSKRIECLRFPLIVGVVFIHTYGTTVSYSDASIGSTESSKSALLIQTFISSGAASIAVPLFFFISGLLFYTGFQWSIRNFLSKLRSRVNTLIIPFVIWNVLTFLVLGIAQNNNLTAHFFSGTKENLLSLSLLESTSTIIGIGTYPISYQFWFIRDLIVLILLTPLFHILTKNKSIRLLTATLLAAMWYLQVSPLPILDPVAFYFAGATFAKNRTEIPQIDKHGGKITTLAVITLFADTITKNQWYNQYIHNTFIILGISSAFFISGLLCKKQGIHQAAAYLSSASFFVFALHEPLLTMVKKIVYRVIRPESDILVTLLYLSMPLFVITTSLLLNAILIKILPNIQRVLTGGRK